MKFTKFEEIFAWQKARELSKLVKEETKKELFSKDWDLVRQINRSAGSAMDNIAEGHGRGNKKEFLNFLGIAKGSSEECRSQLYRAFDYTYIAEEKHKELNALGNWVSASIQGLINYLIKAQIRGIRYYEDEIFKEPETLYLPEELAEIFVEQDIRFEQPYIDFFKNKT